MYVYIYVVKAFQYFPSRIDTVWIVGDSIIRWAATHILETGPPEDPDFKLGLKVVDVCWKGRGGRRLTHFAEDFKYMCQGSRKLPSVILLHLGTNDIMNSPIQSLQWSFQQCIHLINSLIIRPTIIFSEILPRLYYKGARDEKRVERLRKTINRRFRALLGRCGGHVIRHPGFTQQQVNLYREDGVHLSSQGNVLFLKDLEGGLRYFQLYPQFFAFPPIPKH